MREGSKKDMTMDRKAARKAKMTMRQYEATPADARTEYSSGGTVRGMGAAKRGGKFTLC